MPRVVREESFGEFTVRISERLPDETYETRYAVGVFCDGARVRLPWFDHGYGDDLDYVTRKFNSISKDVEAHVNYYAQ